MSHCESCGKLKRGLCRYCQPQEYIDMMQQALMDLANEPLLKRTWVGLTDEDEIDWDGGDLKSLIKAIEAKLKDKNT